MLLGLTYIVYALLLAFGVPLAIADAPLTETLPAPLVAGVPAVFAIPLLVEAVKAGGLPSRFAPLAAMGFGLVWMLTASIPTFSLSSFLTALAAGPVVGLAAVGGYSAIKSALPSAPATPNQPPGGPHV